MVLILRPEDTRGLISMAEAVEATEVAFRDWGHNRGLDAPRRRIHAPSGVRVSVHQGAAPSFGATGLFTHCEWVRPLAEHQVYPNIAHPAYVLFSSANGDLETIIIGELTPSEWPDVKALTGVRTAAPASSAPGFWRARAPPRSACSAVASRARSTSPPCWR